MITVTTKKLKWKCMHPYLAYSNYPQLKKNRKSVSIPTDYVKGGDAAIDFYHYAEETQILNTKRLVFSCPIVYALFSFD